MKGYLTRCEKIVMQLADKGLTSKEIAKAMGTSERTVETHRSNIIKDFGVHHLQEAIIIAKQLHLL